MSRHNINFVYTYTTPWGIIENGYNPDILKEIYIESLVKKVDNLYNSKFLDYVNYMKKNNTKYNISIVDNRTIWKTPSNNDFTNFYVIENINNKRFDIGHEVFRELNNVQNYYFVILDYNNEITDDFIQQIYDFKVKNSVNRKKIIYVSNTTPIKSVGCGTIISNFDFLKENFMDKLMEYKKNTIIKSFII